MEKTSLILAALALAACSTPKGSGAPVASQGNPPVVVAPQATPVVVAPALRPGMGRVEAVMASSAAAGGTAAPSAYRLHIRMDDGTMQYVDQARGDFRVGDRVEITRDGQIVRR
jgi:hypothetical protein